MRGFCAGDGLVWRDWGSGKVRRLGGLLSEDVMDWECQEDAACNGVLTKKLLSLVLKISIGNRGSNTRALILTVHENSLFSKIFISCHNEMEIVNIRMI